MKALIAALALVTLMASPAFARPAAARPAAQAYTPGTFIFPTRLLSLAGIPPLAVV